MTYKLTPTQARAALAKALRSGDYKQGRGSLQNRDGFCCLGVACDVFQKTEGQGKWEPETSADADSVANPQRFTLADGSHEWAYPSSVIQDWLGFTGKTAPLKTDEPGESIYQNLASKNDYGSSFIQIADLIDNDRVDLKDPS